MSCPLPRHGHPVQNLPHGRLLLVAGMLGCLLAGRAWSQEKAAEKSADKQAEKSPAAETGEAYVSVDERQIVGTWKLVEVHEAGNKVKPPRDVSMTFTKDQLTEKLGAATRQGKYKLNPRKRPKLLDVTTRRADDEEDRSFKMIYELDGDVLRICVKRPGSERPSEFATGDGHLVAVYQREKTAAADGGNSADAPPADSPAK